MPIPLIALALSAFAIGTTEFVIMGLLPQVAGNLSVSIPAAGWLVSGYALGVLVGAPIMALATQKLPHRSALLVLMGIFILGNALCAIAPSYGFLMGARIITALCHGAFFGIGAVEAASLVPEQKRASAIALMFTGLTLANVLGVPAGTALGQFAGWRATFWAVTVIGVAAFIGLAWLLPRHERKEQQGSMLQEFGALRGRAWAALSITVIASASMFALFTYIAPVLNHLTGVSPHGVTITLFIMGIGLTAGNVIGGRLADWNVNYTLLGVFLATAAILFIFALVAHNLILTEIALFAWAAIDFAGVSALQINAVNAGKAAPNLISTLNIAAFNGGNALGAWIGGLVIAHGFGLAAIAPTAGFIALVAFGLVAATMLPGRARLASQTS
jgi:DHA1 family inner membrane transport protein